jgi:hypothetical protein
VHERLRLQTVASALKSPLAWAQQRRHQPFGHLTAQLEVYVTGTLTRNVAAKVGSTYKMFARSATTEGRAQGHA